MQFNVTMRLSVFHLLITKERGPGGPLEKDISSGMTMCPAEASSMDLITINRHY